MRRAGIADDVGRRLQSGKVTLLEWRDAMGKLLESGSVWKFQGALIFCSQAHIDGCKPNKKPEEFTITLVSEEKEK